IKHITSLELLVTPNCRFLAQQLAKTYFKNTMELGDPPLLPLGQGLIVDMGVTDENIIHESFPG
ncbi:MAG TPA: hypothetical protein DEP78_02545, partial [Verrucomicrobiales bacterium]|nr:hypothetical protein [Verrucomicrobiales bacterium]